MFTRAVINHLKMPQGSLQTEETTRNTRAWFMEKMKYITYEVKGCLTPMQLKPYEFIVS